MTVLEKAARAAALAAHRFYNGEASDDVVWASLDAESREVRLAEARAALSAVRSAINEEWSPEAVEFGQEIDAILAETPA